MASKIPSTGSSFAASSFSFFGPTITDAKFPLRDGHMSSMSVEKLQSLAVDVKKVVAHLSTEPIEKTLADIRDLETNKSQPHTTTIQLLSSLKEAAEKGLKEKIAEIVLQLPPEEQKILKHAICLWHNMSDYEVKDDKALGRESHLKSYPLIAIYENPETLLHPAPPFIHVTGGSLIDQLLCYTKKNLEAHKLNKNIQLLRLIAEQKDAAKIHQIFQALDPDVAKKLKRVVLEQFSIPLGDDGSNIQKITEKLPQQDKTALHVIAEELKVEFTGKVDREKKAQFLNLYESNLIGHKELKGYFKNLSKELQQDPDVPKPPYYGKGVRDELYNIYGSHYSPDRNTTSFKTFAPAAKQVDLLIFKEDETICIPMKKQLEGNWQVEIEAPVGTKYQYKILGIDDKERIKADPYAQGALVDTKTGTKTQYSIVSQSDFAWTDDAFIAERSLNPDAPATIYEVHVGSWRVNEDGSKKNWQKLAEELATYCKEMNFTHVEIFGALTHPAEVSWGYQPSGFFSVNEKLGSLSDFKYFINHMHSQGIKVILDWVPGHFAKDDFCLREYDGSHLFEHEDLKRSLQRQWDVYTLDLEKKNVRDFLISSANFFAKECHIDGLRVDAVSSLLYTSEGREGHFLPHYKGKKNHHGGIHSDAKIFLRDLNTILHEKHKGLETYAEESTGFEALTGSIQEKKPSHPYSKRGLGFDKKWGMGSMNHTLTEYFRKKPTERHLDKLSSAMKIDADESIVHVTSHDETANGKGSLRCGMKADGYIAQFAKLRLYHTKTMATPGVKLTMMGNEIGQEEEWSGRFIRHIKKEEPGCSGVDWKALDAPWPSERNFAQLTRDMFKDLNKLYIEHPALSHGNKASNFTWIKADDVKNHVMSFHRTSADGKRRVMCVFNFGDNLLENYKITLPSASYDPLNKKITSLTPIFSSDDMRYGGEGRNINPKLTNNSKEVSLRLNLPPSTAVILEEGLSD